MALGDLLVTGVAVIEKRRCDDDKKILVFHLGQGFLGAGRLADRGRGWLPRRLALKSAVRARLTDDKI